jgi:hypothetical protein
MSDTPTLVMFESGYAEDGTDEHGMPTYRETIIIQLDRPPLLSLRRTATEDDFEDYPEAYRQFTKLQANKKITSDMDGYPLVYWPVPTASELKMCLDRDIVTVQQLAALTKRGADKVPPPIMELAKRAAKMVELTAKIGKFEKVIASLTAENEAMLEQIKECQITISAQNSMIDQLKTRVA